MLHDLQSAPIHCYIDIALKLKYCFVSIVICGAKKSFISIGAISMFYLWRDRNTRVLPGFWLKVATFFFLFQGLTYKYT